MPLYIGGDNDVQLLFDKYGQPQELPLLMKELNKLGRHALVTELYELPAAQGNMQCLQQYLNALTTLGRVTYPDSSTSSSSSSSSSNPNQKSYDLDNQVVSQVAVRVTPGRAEWVWRLVLAGVFVMVVFNLFNGAPLLGSSKQTWSESKNATNTFDDVKGIDETIDQVRILVDFLTRPRDFQEIGAKLPRGVLFVGPPGTGKTLLARAIAGEAGVPFLYVTGADFDEIFVGLGAQRVRNLFKEAHDKAPCIVFIDEIDSIGRTRERSMATNSDSLNKLLAEMDGFEEAKGILVIAATNLANTLDPALLRPGRFDYHISFDLPDKRGRQEILKLYFSKYRVDESVDSLFWASATYGWSGAAIANLVNQAGIVAVRNGSPVITNEHLHTALDDVSIGLAKTSRSPSLEEKTATAFHECGHALVNYFSERGLPIRKITLVARGNTLGSVSQVPVDDFGHVTKLDLQTRIASCMGGRVAEELIYGPENVSTGASSDLENATNIARHMVERFGMSDDVGPVYYADDKRGQGNAKIEQEVARLCKEGYDRAKAILTEHNAELHALTAALLERETILGSELEQILGVKGKLRALPDND